MANPFCWIELMTPNLEGAKDFYAKLFDWKISPFPGPMAYYAVDAGAPPGGGMMGLPEPGAPTMWSVYVAVDDVDKYAAKVAELGGKVWKGPQDIPGVGRFAVVSDPQGACFNIFQAAGPAQ